MKALKEFFNPEKTHSFDRIGSSFDTKTLVLKVELVNSANFVKTNEAGIKQFLYSMMIENDYLPQVVNSDIETKTEGPMGSVSIAVSFEGASEAEVQEQVRGKLLTYLYQILSFSYSIDVTSAESLHLGGDGYRTSRRTMPSSLALTSGAA